MVSVLVSLASLVSFPALLALGLSPVGANVTNTVALVFTGVGATAGSRGELAGIGRIVLRLSVLALVGGSVGATLLLLAPASTFQMVVPFLIGGASLFLLLQPRLARRWYANDLAAQGIVSGDILEGVESVSGTPNGVGTIGNGAGAESRRRRLLLVLLFGAFVYSGYFGAAGGILIMATLAAMFPGWTSRRANAAKNVVAMCANGAATLQFAVFGPVHWAFVLPLGLGFLLGGWVGPILARRLPDNALRVAAATCGVAFAVKLAL
ncbi:sulfite exporter TauE/SafE family protein [Nocardia alni]|uniref:sulfite exporter TauE/SafE family protein n=1 Tax=Nocardia alni TaxID=2815723 RepID=UPI003F6821D7